MADQCDGSGEKADGRGGFRQGEPWTAWRLFLIDLLIIPAPFVGVIGIFTLAAAPVATSILLDELIMIAGLETTIGLGKPATFAVIVAAAPVAMAREAFQGGRVLRGRGEIDGIRFCIAALR
jgi:hypothetical protein